MDGVVVEETWRDARRGRMLAAAARVFARANFEHASMDEIAHEAGVGKPTLYRYYPSKDALFAAVFETALDDLETRLERVLANTHGARERLAALFAAIIPTVREHLVSLRFFGDTAAGVDQSKRRVFRERRSRIAGYIGRAIDDGVAAGEMRPVDGNHVGHLLIGMLWSAAAHVKASDAEIGRDVVDLVVHGLVSRSLPDDDGAGAAGTGPARASGASERPCSTSAAADLVLAHGART